MPAPQLVILSAAKARFTSSSFYERGHVPSSFGSSEDGFVESDTVLQQGPDGGKQLAGECDHGYLRGLALLEPLHPG